MTDPLGTPYGPCDNWPVTWTCDVSAESPPATGAAVAAASQILHALSGRRFGLCSVTLRPCQPSAGWPFDVRFDPFGWTWSLGGGPLPALVGGLWYNLCSCQDSCDCAPTSEVRLPGRVYQITQVKIDGAPLVTGAYRVDDARTLVRTDGKTWPTSNDLDKADTQTGTWSVTAQYGRPVPAGGDVAIGELACELLRSFRGEDCRLPRNVTQLARQGVTIQMQDIGGALKEGKTGFPVTDLWLLSVNPAGLASPSKAYSVDRVLGRRAGT